MESAPSSVVSGDAAPDDVRTGGYRRKNRNNFGSRPIERASNCLAAAVAILFENWADLDLKDKTIEEETILSGGQKKLRFQFISNWTKFFAFRLPILSVCKAIESLELIYNAA